MSLDIPPIAGFQPLSLVDYPKEVTAVIFTQGCNLHCPFCHNHDLIPMHALAPLTPWNHIWEKLLKNQRVVPAVTLSGGEPTIHQQLIHWLSLFRQHHFKIKLDTNGTQPQMIQHIINENLVDYIAMDIKAPLDQQMATAIGKQGFVDKMAQSLEWISQSHIPHEFRTTLHHHLKEHSLKKIQTIIPSHSPWIIQQCHDVPGYYQAPTRTKPHYLSHPHLSFRGFSSSERTSNSSVRHVTNTHLHG